VEISQNTLWKDLKTHSKHFSLFTNKDNTSHKTSPPLQKKPQKVDGFHSFSLPVPPNFQTKPLKFIDLMIRSHATIQKIIFLDKTVKTDPTMQKQNILEYALC